MKPFIFLLCFFPLKILCALSQTEAEQLVHLGHQHFSEKKYDEAIQAYTQALTFHPSAQVYYNLGQAYALNHKPGFALAYYLKALRWHAHWDLVLQEIDRLYAENPYLAPLPRPWYRQLFSLGSWDAWSWGCAFCFWAFLWLFVYAKLKRKAKKYYILPSVLLLMSCGMGILLGLNRTFKDVCLLPEATTARFAPTDTSPERYQWPMGTQCWIQNEREGYYFVNISNGEDGWVKKQELIALK